MRRSFQPDELIGGQYRVERVLRGGMACVYIAVDDVSGKRFALKTIRDDANDGGRQQELLTRFEREATAWINLDHHPHIVQAHAFFRYEDKPFLLLEYVDGPSMAEVLKATNRLALSQACKWAAEVCSAMEYVHSKRLGNGQLGVIHRDFKPGNLLITRSGKLKITDFGLAKVHDDRELTQTDQFLGTLAYCSPEQLRSTRNVDRTSDIFSFGVVLYEMVVGSPPFAGDSPSKLIDAVQHRAPDIERVPQSIRGTVVRCLQKSPARRFPTFEDVSQALQAVDPDGADDGILLECRTCGFCQARPITCPVCKHEIGTGDLGSTLIKDCSPSTSHSAHREPLRDNSRCRCGATIPSGVYFCRQCGAPVPKSRCECGEWNPTSNAFCNRCGAMLYSSSQRGRA